MRSEAEAVLFYETALFSASNDYIKLASQMQLLQFSNYCA